MMGSLGRIFSGIQPKSAQKPDQTGTKPDQTGINAKHYAALEEIIRKKYSHLPDGIKSELDDQLKRLNQTVHKINNNKCEVDDISSLVTGNMVGILDGCRISLGNENPVEYFMSEVNVNAIRVVRSFQLIELLGAILEYVRKLEDDFRRSDLIEEYQSIFMNYEKESDLNGLETSDLENVINEITGYLLRLK